jgi:hypothetical protein
MDVDLVRPYRPRRYPVIPGGEASYIVDELQRIHTTLDQVRQVLELLEARIETLEP